MTKTHSYRQRLIITNSVHKVNRVRASRFDLLLDEYMLVRWAILS